MNKLTLGSLFDGSGGFPLGGLISGITPVWASEIEPFPNAPVCKASRTGGAMTWALSRPRMTSVIGAMSLKPTAGSWVVPQSPSL